MTTDGERRTGWWHTLYWRVGVGFVALVAALLLVQSAIFIYWVDRGGGPRQDQLRRVLAAAAELGRAGDAGAAVDTAAVLRRYTDDGGPLYAVLVDGTALAGDGGPVPDGVRQTARLMLRAEAPARDQPMPGGGPATYAPIQAGGSLRGVVVASPPPVRGFLRELTRVVSPLNFVLLLGLTAIAALVLVGPARRRLTGLEAAALRVAGGDLGARAPDDGRDEVSRVARAFNRMSAELAARDAALQAADRSRRQLFADVSHELKTPLTAMRGYLETLAMDDGLEADRRRRYLGTVLDETRRLERIVADLLDLARIEPEGGALNVRVFAPARIFERIARRHERETLRRAIIVERDVSADADQLSGDPDRLEQAVDNLVANALRHLPDGGRLTLRAAIAAGTAVVSVIDTGTGIPAEHLPHVFDRFYKADPARAAAGASGSGLGLSIVKAIVERHGGRVGVTSAPGHTVFTITLPHGAIADAADPPAATAAADDQAGSTNL